jgi:hypothetical protein
MHRELKPVGADAELRSCHRQPLAARSEATLLNSVVDE